eukprot:3538735-Rhodomonas_salina.2
MSRRTSAQIETAVDSTAPQTRVPLTRHAPSSHPRRRASSARCPPTPAPTPTVPRPHPAPAHAARQRAPINIGFRPRHTCGTRDGNAFASRRAAAKRNGVGFRSRHACGTRGGSPRAVRRNDGRVAHGRARCMVVLWMHAPLRAASYRTTRSLLEQCSMLVLDAS